MSNSLSTSYLRLQAERCQRLSRMCMDLGTARDLRLMADEYIADAVTIEKSERQVERCDSDYRRGDTAQGQSAVQMQQQPGIGNIRDR